MLVFVVSRVPSMGFSGNQFALNFYTISGSGVFYKA